MNLRFLLLSGLFICAAQAGEVVPEKKELVTVKLQGQRYFLDNSVAFCSDRIPALRVELNRARNIAAQEMSKAEEIIADGITPTIRRDRPLLDAFLALWKKNADDLFIALQKQNPEVACPAIRDNWAGVEAAVIIEDWQTYLERNRPEQ